jgi:LPS-assembly protein
MAGGAERMSRTSYNASCRDSGAIPAHTLDEGRRRMRLGAAWTTALLFFTVFRVCAVSCAHAEEPSKRIPLTVAADKLDYNRDSEVYAASGHVKIEQDGFRIEADKVVLNNKTGEAEAEGNVRLQDGADDVHAAKLKLNVNTRAGVIYHGDLYMKKDNYHIEGESIERRSDTVYYVERGRFTTCDEDQWSIKADELRIDLNRYAVGRGVTFNVEDVPVLYTPYLLFPVRRQSGLLIPMVGYGRTDGFFADNALFLALSDSRDMTIYSDYRKKIGHGTAVEYRYNNSQESAGEAYAKYWDMRNSNESRWEFRFQHREEFAEDLSARADINLVGDENYYHDLERSLDQRSRPYIDSNAFYVERWNTAALYLLGQYAVDLTRPNDQTVQKLPELRYTVFEESSGGPIHINFEGSATNFSKKSGNDTRRVDINPEATMSFGNGGLSLTPRAGVRATFYNRSAATYEPTERKFAYAGADFNARVSSVYGADGDAGVGRVRHSIEPSISYKYIPHVDQGSIPQMDFIDSVSALNITTVSIINRLTAHYKESVNSPNYSTFDLMVLRISQSYDLNVVHDASDTAKPQSDILGELYVRTPKRFTLSANGSYDTVARTMTSHSSGGAYSSGALSLNLSEQYIKDPATQYLIGGGGYTLGKWNAGVQWWRDMELRKTTQEDYALNYLAQCWGLRLTYTHTPGDYRYTAMLDLKGMGNRAYGK